MGDELDFSSPILVLAPLAGYTDLPFRSVVKKFGADLTISEMISSNALIYNSQKTLKMLKKDKSENPFFVQFMANDKQVLKDAVQIINDIDGIGGIDLNCGCPAPKVFKNQAGSSLLGDLDKLQLLVQTIKDNSNKRYTTAKIRIGIDEKIPIDIAKACEAGGADIISVHGRTKAGGYKSEVDYEAIGQIKQNVKVKVIANGDIKDYETYKKVIDYTGVDGAMIGRGAVGKPWVFYQIKHQIDNISNDIKKTIILEHYAKMIEFYEDFGVIMFRKHLHTYSKGYKKASEFRELINNTKDVNITKQLIGEFF